MKKVFKKGICLFLSLLMLTSGIGVFAADTTAASTSTPRVFVIGDSTACSYDWESERTGWGEALQNFLTDPKMVVNAASSGDSAHSFYDEEWNWNTVKARLNRGDYLLIQFGHNDSAQSGKDDEGNSITDLSRYSNPELASTVAPPTELSTSTDDYSYKWYLKQYIEYANSVGAYPILVTSVERKSHAAYTDETNSSLYKYVTAMEQLSQQEFPTVPVIDVWRGVRAGYAEDWYVSDGTHLAEKGAMEVARIFANKLKASSVSSAQSLSNYLVDNIDAITTHTDVIVINEDFEDYIVPSEGNLFPGKPLDSTTDNRTESTYGYVMEENEDNNMLKIVASSSAYNVNWTLPYQLTSGYYKLKYRFRSDKNDSNNMEFVTTIGSYGATTRYAKNSINYSSSDNLNALGVNLRDGEWTEVEYYFAPRSSNGSMYIHCNGTMISNATATNKSNLAKVGKISIGFGTNKSGTLYLDDIEFSEISEKDYNLAIGNIPVVAPPAGITAMEDFEYAKAGTAITTTHYGWTRESSNAAVPMTYVTDPTNTNNIVANIKSTVSKINANRTLAYNLTGSLTDYAYSVKFRLYAADEDSNEFWLSIMDTDSDGSETADKLSRHYIGFRMNTDYVSMYSTEDGVANTEAAANYDFNLNTWYDIEVVYDLTPESTINASVYINGKKLINRARVGGGANYTNDGTITSFQFQIPSDTRAHILGEATAEDGIYASFLLDDIVIKQTSIVTGVAVAENVLSGVSAYFDAAPSASPKFVAAVYDGRALKDIAFASATAIAGSQSVSLSKALSVASGNTVKVYYWDMTNLIPCIKMFETDIQ